MTKTLITLLLAIAGMTGASAQQPPRAAVTQIFSEPMMEFLGKQVRSFLVEFPPGGESVPHTHPGPLFAYVLSGTWTMQMEGSDEKTYRSGQVAYEHAHHKHLISKNSSATEPLKLVVFFISEPGAPVSIPVPAQQ